jgi:lysophospholipid acyltransferase (LPLAT)-like uncharacterized protein
MEKKLSKIAAGLLSKAGGMSLAHRSLSTMVGGILSTVRVKVEGEAGVLDALRDGPVLFAFWHGKQMPLLAYRPKYRLVTLVSHSKDGELLARILHDRGHEIVRGSSSRGGSEGFTAMAEHMKKGFSPCFAADGPRGPLRMSKPGPIRLAAMTGRPLFPASSASTRHATMGSWDRLEVPAPFSSVALSFGKPMTFRTDITAEELYSATVILSAAIDQCTLRAEHLLGISGG